MSVGGLNIKKPPTTPYSLALEAIPVSIQGIELIHRIHRGRTLEHPANTQINLDKNRRANYPLDNFRNGFYQGLKGA